MKFRIGPAGLAFLGFAAAISAQTGVSGQPGIPTTGVLTTVPDASSSPVIAPPPAAAPAPPEVSTPAPPPPASPFVPAPRANPAPSPAHAPGRATPPALSGPAATAPPSPSVSPSPAPESPEPAEEAESKPGKRRGADFYTPYLRASDTLDNAILDLTRRVKERPEDPGLRNDLGNLLARRGFAKEAREEYEKAEKLDREFFLADYNEGLLWEKEGKTANAIAAYRRSIRRKPGFPLSRFHLGFLYEKVGRAEAAVREYAKALRIDPTLRSPRRNPLVVQTRLLYRASLANYDRDLAAAALASDGEFADRAVWERLQPQRPVDTADLDDAPDDAEAEAGGPPPGAPASTSIIGGKPSAPSAVSTDPRRQQLIEQFRRSRRPAAPTRANPSRTQFPGGMAPAAPAPPPPAATELPPPPDEAPVVEPPPGGALS